MKLRVSPDMVSVGILIALLAASAIMLAIGFARAHDAPTGWTYPWSCCSSMDCQQVGDKAVGEPTKDSHGYTIVSTGEFIAEGDKRIKDSPDGLYHWCAHPAGIDAGHTICLFVPPKGY